MINRILTAGILTLSLLAPVATSAAVPPPVSKEASRLQALRNARVGIGGVRVMSQRQLRLKLAELRKQRSRPVVVRPPSRPTTPVPPTTPVKPPVYDPLGDGSVRSDILLLGQSTPILAGVRVFSNQEPIDVTQVQIDLVSPASSISQMLVYDEKGVLLGTASKTNGSYIANLPTSKLQLPYRKELSLYVRARLKPHDSGGTSGEDIHIDDVTVRGYGSWSNEPRGTTSDDAFPIFQSARARITAVKNADSADGILVAGTDQRIGAFTFTAEESDPSAAARLTDLTFTAETFGGVGLSNVKLRREGSSESFNCSIASSTITCANISAAFGEIDREPLVLRVHADISLPVSTDDMFLRLALNQSGTPFDTGAIEWTDGEANFGWVGTETPIVRGTAYKR